jgi:hypothetical protein
MPRIAYTFETTVHPGGKVELTVPISEGSRVEVVVLTEEADEIGELLQAATSSTRFWDNPIDDAEWNNA